LSCFININSGNHIGEGLFAINQIQPDEVISKFIGVIIDDAEYERRKSLGKGGYAIRIKIDNILDCYDYCKDRKCWASFANSPLNLVDPHIPQQKFQKANARILIYPENASAYLVSSKIIYAEEEILWKYGATYDRRLLL